MVEEEPRPPLSASAERKRQKAIQIEGRRANAVELALFNEKKRQEKVNQKNIEKTEKFLLKEEDKFARLNIQQMTRLNKRLEKELKFDTSPYTKLKSTETLGVLYFACSIGKGVFGKLFVPEQYSMKGPLITFINPVFEIDCEPQWSPALTITRFIESVLVSDDILVPDYDHEDDEKFNLAEENFPGFFDAKNF